MEISKHQAATSRPILPLKLQGLGLTPEYPFLLSTEVNKPHHHQIHPTKHHHCSNTISLTVLHHVIIIQSATQAKSQQPPEPHHQTNKQQQCSKVSPPARFSCHHPQDHDKNESQRRRIKQTDQCTHTNNINNQPEEEPQQHTAVSMPRFPM